MGEDVEEEPFDSTHLESIITALEAEDEQTPWFTLVLATLCLITAVGYIVKDL